MVRNKAGQEHGQCVCVPCVVCDRGPHKAKGLIEMKWEAPEFLEQGTRSKPCQQESCLEQEKLQEIDTLSCNSFTEEERIILFLEMFK